MFGGRQDKDVLVEVLRAFNFVTIPFAAAGCKKVGEMGATRKRGDATRAVIGSKATQWFLPPGHVVRRIRRRLPAAS